MLEWTPVLVACFLLAAPGISLSRCQSRTISHLYAISWAFLLAPIYSWIWFLPGVFVHQAPMWPSFWGWLTMEMFNVLFNQFYCSTDITRWFRIIITAHYFTIFNRTWSAAISKQSSCSLRLAYMFLVRVFFRKHAELCSLAMPCRQQTVFVELFGRQNSLCVLAYRKSNIVVSKWIFNVDLSAQHRKIWIVHEKMVLLWFRKHCIGCDERD